METPLLDPNAPNVNNGGYGANDSVVLRCDDDLDNVSSGAEGERAADTKRDTNDGGGVSVSRSIFVMTNAILGGGILGQAYAAKSAGWALFLLMQALMACAADFAILQLIEMCAAFGLDSYEEVGRRAFGTRGKRAVTAFIVMQNTGSMTSYCVIFMTLFPDILKSALGGAHLGLSREALLLLASALIVAPLSLLRRISFLSLSGGYCLAVMLVFTGSVVFRFGAKDVPCPLPAAGAPTPAPAPAPAHHAHASSAAGDGLDDDATCHADAFRLSAETAFVLPIMCFSFVCHTVLCPVYAELRARPSEGPRHTKRARMVRVGHVAICLSALLYTLSGLLGYLMFYDATTDDLLATFQLVPRFKKDPFTLALYAAYCLAVILTVPVILFPTRRTLLLTFWPRGDGHGGAAARNPRLRRNRYTGDLASPFQRLTVRLRSPWMSPRTRTAGGHGAEGDGGPTGDEQQGNRPRTSSLPAGAIEDAGDGDGAGAAAAAEETKISTKQGASKKKVTFRGKAPTPVNTEGDVANAAAAVVDDDGDAGGGRVPRFRWWKHAGCGLALVVLVTCLALALGDNIKKVFGVVGATSSVAIVFLMPSAFYLKLMPPMAGGSAAAARRRRLRAASWAMIVLGACVCPACVTGVILSLIKQAKEQAQAHHAL